MSGLRNTMMPSHPAEVRAVLHSTSNQLTVATAPDMWHHNQKVVVQWDY